MDASDSDKDMPACAAFKAYKHMPLHTYVHKYRYYVYCTTLHQHSVVGKLKQNIKVSKCKIKSQVCKCKLRSRSIDIRICVQNIW